MHVYKLLIICIIVIIQANIDEAMTKIWAVVPAGEKDNALVAMDATIDVRHYIFDFLCYW
jgi:hypothetical protein